VLAKPPTFPRLTSSAQFLIAAVHNLQPSILAPRDYQEYLENTELPPIHLLRVFPDDEMRAEEIDQEAISNEQASLFDSQCFTMTKKRSAGLIMYRWRKSQVEVFLVHPGGPFWGSKDKGAWSIPKGEYADGEEPFEVAKREFCEEKACSVPPKLRFECCQLQSL
jgi:hypothetical protein